MLQLFMSYSDGLGLRRILSFFGSLYTEELVGIMLSVEVYELRHSSNSVTVCSESLYLDFGRFEIRCGEG